MEMARLKNGSEEVRGFVAAMMFYLTETWKEKPIVMFELVMLCRDPKHNIFAGADDLVSWGFLSKEGTVHDSIRNIVLSAVTGDDFAMKLGSPFVETEATR